MRIKIYSCVGLSLVLFFLGFFLSCYKEKVKVSEEGFIFITSNKKFFCIIEQEYLTQFFGNVYDKHIYIRHGSYKNFSLHKEWIDLNTACYVPFLYLGRSSNITVSAPLFFCTNSNDDGEEKKECISVEGLEISLFCKECEKMVMLFLNYKERKIECKEEISCNMDEIKAYIKE